MLQVANLIPQLYDFPLLLLGFRSKLVQRRVRLLNPVIIVLVHFSVVEWWGCRPLLVLGSGAVVAVGGLGVPAAAVMLLVAALVVLGRVRGIIAVAPPVSTSAVF